MPPRDVKLPDVGEGIAEAELIEFNVKIGDLVREDDVLAAVMTDKATVEIPSPLSGKIVWIGARAGEIVAIGSTLLRVDEQGVEASARMDEADSASVDASETEAGTPEPAPAPRAIKARDPVSAETPKPAAAGAVREHAPARNKPVASPAVRLAAREAGVDLRLVAGSGPAGRITHADLETYTTEEGRTAASGRARKTAVKDVKVVGLRRRIAERMSLATSRIPHITLVEETDVTALEALRASLNAKHAGSRPKLTLLPFVMRAITRAVVDHPELNARYDDDAGVIHQHSGVHIGIATQTSGGLMVPVVRHVEAKGLWDCAAELRRIADTARQGTASRDDLTGSTITITSLGALGGIATTPVINYPEVAIVGINRMVIRPVWNGTSFVPRSMMNLSSSFDHRVIDGWVAAVFVKQLKDLIETPATIFVDE